MACSFCGEEKVYAKGFCNACYLRARHNGGNPEYQRKFIKAEDQCKEEGCYRRVIAEGWCERHYRLAKAYGEPASSFGYGNRRKHPLYEHWRQQARCAEGRVEEWNDFWKFVADVGEKPSLEHVARRTRPTEAWGVTNFTWTVRTTGCANAAEYQRAWNKKNPLRSKGYKSKTYYGVSTEEYLSRYEAQGGRCSICGDKGMSYAGSEGRSKTLVIDHCHATGKVRELLCARCNKALGGFQDDSDIIRKAAEYIDKWKIST